MKTIINAIQARHESTQAAIETEEIYYDDNEVLEAHKDRQALLDILSEIGRLPDKWREQDSDGWIKFGYGCADELQKILNRTEP